MSEVVTRSQARRSMRRRALRETSGPDALPMELLTQVLSYLSVPSLRRASGVSRRFYASAWASGLYIDRQIIWNQPRSCEKQVVAFQELVQHALRKNLHLKLTLLVWPSLQAVPPTQLAVDQAKPQMRKILAAIKSALPLLAYLTVQVVDFDDDIAAALRHPAPRLQELEISRSIFCRSDGIPLSSELFAGNAPVLRKVELGNINLATSVPAFERVTFLRFAYAEIPDIPLALHFPRLTALELETSTSGTPAGLLAGVSLRSLVLDEGINMLDIRCTVNLDKIPELRLDCDAIQWVEPEIDNAADFSLRISSASIREVELSVAVVPVHRRWRRTYDIAEWSADIALPIVDKPGGTAHLTYLRVDSAFLHTFLSCNTAFPTLRIIKIDLDSRNDHPATIWPPDMLSPPFGLVFDAEDKTSEGFYGQILYRDPCPALEEVILFAIDQIITVQSREAAFLGQALGQVTRPKREKAALVLVGIEFAKPLARSLLEKTFSAVQHCGFSGWHSKEDYDEGLWENVV